MALITLLDVVQGILSDADGDEVNSINDTVESTQVAQVVRDTFRSIVDVHDIKCHDQTVQLDATSATTPTTMTRPAGLEMIQWVKYDARRQVADPAAFRDIIWRSPKDFLDSTERRSTDATDVEQVTLSSGHILKIKNDVTPTYWTQLEGYDDIVFDSYDAVVDTNLQASKVLAYGTIVPDLALTDTATFDIPENLVGLVRDDARAYYFDVFKGGATREIDRRRRQSSTRAQRKRWLNANVNVSTGPYYGRK